MFVCARILARLAASDQTDHGPGRGKINLVGGEGTKCRKCTTEGEEGRGGEEEEEGQEDSKTLHPNLILWGIRSCPDRPGLLQQQQ